MATKVLTSRRRGYIRVGQRGETKRWDRKVLAKKVRGQKRKSGKGGTRDLI